MESLTKHLEVNIRDATLEDASTLSNTASELFKSAFQDKMSKNDLLEYLTTALSYTSLVKELQDKRNKFFLAISDNNLVGYAKLTTNLKLNTPNHDIEIERLYIRKSLCGKGIGSLLMEHCIKVIKQLGHKSVCLACWERNEDAIHFYKKCEFHVCGEQIFTIGSDPQRGILFTKSID